jgi:TldD protein
LVDGDKKFSDNFDRGANLFKNLVGLKEEIMEKFEKSVNFMENSVDVKPGKYAVILSPIAAGVFAHESFGHKSEADLMIGDEMMKREWQLGKRVGSDILSIVDDGNIKGTGYIPFDDEGTKAEETYLIKNGILSGRLHSAATATDLDEDLTGNARAKDFEFEPIVRMTVTYIKPGKKTFKELISDTEEGILVETIKHGSGMSTFTIAPLVAYKIEKGKITEPVKISVVSGDVFKTLGEIEGLSNKLEILSFAMGGCGKMEQFPLPVSFGGPYVKVKELDVQ